MHLELSKVLNMNFDDDKVRKLALTMASEWNDWPCLFAMAIGQMFLISFSAHNVIICFVIVEIIWFFIAEKFVNYNLALQFHGLCRLCWVSSLLMSVILFMQGRILTSIIALAWIFLLMSISFLVFLVLGFIMKPFGILPPRVEIIELKMKASILELSPEETKYYIAVATDLMENAKEEKYYDMSVSPKRA